MSGKKKLIFGLIVAVILVTASLSVVFIIQRQQEKPSWEEYQEAQDFLAADDPARALGPLFRASLASAKDAPEKELQYCLETVRLAAELGNKYQVINLQAKHLWDDLGRRDEEILLMLLSVYTKPLEERLAYGLELVAQMEDSPEKTKCKADILLGFDHIEEAAVIYEELYAQSPTAEIISALSNCYLRMNELTKAVDLLNENREKGLLGADSYRILAEIYAWQDKYEEAHAVYEEAKQNNKYVDSLQLREAITYFSNSQNNECKKLLEGIINPYRLGLVNQEMKSFIITRKFKEFVKLLQEGTQPFAAKILPLMHPSTREMIAAFDPEKSSTSELFVAFVVDFNRILAGESLYDKTIFPDNEKFLNRTNELLAIVSPTPDELFELNRYLLTEGFRGYIDVPEPSYLASRARVYLSSLADETEAETEEGAVDPLENPDLEKARRTERIEQLKAKRLDRINKLESMAQGERPWLEGERFFYQYMRERLTNTGEPVETLNHAYRLLETYPPVIVQVGRENTMQEKYADAISAYEKVMKTDRVFARSHIIQFEIALSLARDEKYKEALGIIANLHRRKYITRATLEVFRDLSEKLNIEKGMNLAQDLLEDIYKNDPKVEYQGAMMHWRAGDFEKSYEAFTKLTVKYPENETLEYMRLASLLGTKDYERLLQECNQSKLPPERMAGLRADALENLKRYNEALAAYKKAVEDPNAAPIFRIRYGRLLVNNNQQEEGIAQLQAALEKDPENVLANLGMATVAMMTNDYQTARKYIKKVTDKQPDDIVEVYQLLAEADYAENKIESAEANIHRAINVDPRNIRNNYLLGKIQNRKGEFKDAKRNLAAYLQEVPKDVDALFQLVHALNALQEYESALMIIDNLIETNPQSIQLRQTKFSLLVGAKRLEEAKKLLALIKSSLKDIEALRYEAQILEASGDLPGAINLLKTRLIDKDVAFYWASLMLKNKSPEGVLEVTQKHNYPSNAIGQLAILADMQGYPDLASMLYERAVEQDPNNFIWQNNFAWANLRSGNPDQEKILTAITKAFELAPGEISVLDTYASALTTFKQSEECVTLLTNNINLTLSSKSLAYYLAVAYEGQGEFGKALEYYERAKSMKGELTNISVSNADLDAKIIECKNKGE
ncbi:MAG: tetratricopeptide repeat protein [Planctomycetes bacterium]|nr:tetratricopeptide repeat protein [Planctomycetota bacterium]